MRKWVSELTILGMYNRLKVDGSGIIHGWISENISWGDLGVICCGFESEIVFSTGYELHRIVFRRLIRYTGAFRFTLMLL